MSMEEYKPFIETFPDNDSSDYSKEKLVSEYFKQVKHWHNKHFKQWREEYLHLAIAGDTIPAKYLCKWILGQPLVILDNHSYLSSVHKTTIQTPDIVAFLTANVSAADQRKKEFYSMHEEAIKEIANGASLWDLNSIPKTSKYSENMWKRID